MTKRIVLCVAALALTCCATRPAPRRPAEIPPPKAVDVRICAEVPASPAMPRSADLVQPETPAEKIGFNAFMTWVAQLVDHDAGVTDRAILAKKEGCPKA